jgi:hypothetical protein
VVKGLIVVLWILLASGLAQVTYSNTPTQEELEQYFFGGMPVLEVDVPISEELRYQLINMKDMQTLWAGSTGNLINAAPDGFTARFSFAISDFFADWCGIRFQAFDPNDVKFEFFQARLNVDTGEPRELTIGDGSNDCIYFDADFNWGHWTNILADDTEPLSQEGWIPVLAFIPNYLKDSNVEYGSADTWLVLLITFDDLNYGANPNELSQEEVIALLQDYGLDTTP